MDGNSFKQRYGPWALVAGGTEGLGLAFGEAIARRGVNLLLAGRDAQRLEAALDQIRWHHSVKIDGLPCDLSRRDEIDRLVEWIGKRRVGLLVANAAASPIGRFLDVELERHEAVVELNCRATTALAYRLGKGMAKRGRGGIVLVSSLASLQGTALVASYAASKAYLRVLAEGLWAELRRDGVDVLACCPGPVDTPNWRRSMPARAGWFVPRPDDAATVAEGCIRNLSRGPVWMPPATSFLARIVHRFLPVAWSVKLASAGTACLYGRREDRFASRSNPG